ncbi:MAG: protein kinase [Myxococcales bacterium]|nr:protein kinase [Myxococcales bacterium]
MIGRTLGSYKITEKLGEGGMGAVYLAEHTLMGMQVAIKVLLPQYSSVSRVIDRFFNEAKSASLVRHPGIVEIYDFGKQEDGSAFIVMELLQGEELAELLRREPRLHSQRVALLGQQVATALAAAHALGIVHRDLKPDNIFLEPDSAAVGGVRAKILDFGLAKLADDISGAAARTQAGAVLGTPSYMAPEQCLGQQNLDHRADIYSLGCILYQLVCGRPPFVGTNLGELLAAHVNTAPQALALMEPSVAPNLEAIIMSTLAKAPEERPQSMTALATSLGTLMGDQAAIPARADLPIAKTMLADEVAPSAPAPAKAFALATTASPRRSSWPALLAGLVLAGAAGAVIALQLGGATDKVALFVDSSPQGASVYNMATGVELGTTPFRDARESSQSTLELRLSLSGYETQTFSVLLAGDVSKTLTMVATTEGAAEAAGKSNENGQEPPSAGGRKKQRSSETTSFKKQTKAKVSKGKKAGLKKASKAKATAKSTVKKWNGKVKKGLDRLLNK